MFRRLSTTQLLRIGGISGLLVAAYLVGRATAASSRWWALVLVTMILGFSVIVLFQFALHRRLVDLLHELIEEVHQAQDIASRQSHEFTEGVQALTMTVVRVLSADNGGSPPPRRTRRS